MGRFVGCSALLSPYRVLWSRPNAVGTNATFREKWCDNGYQVDRQIPAGRQLQKSLTDRDCSLGQILARVIAERDDCRAAAEVVLYPRQEFVEPLLCRRAKVPGSLVELRPKKFRSENSHQLIALKLNQNADSVL